MKRSVDFHRQGVIGRGECLYDNNCFSLLTTLISSSLRENLYHFALQLYKSMRKKKEEKKEEFLRQYYSDFHYDVDKGKFRMTHDSSDEDEARAEEEGEWLLLYLNLIIFASFCLFGQ